MNLQKASELIIKYGVCPECKNDKVGAGEGVLSTNNGVFFRSCKCGWKIRVDENGNVLPNIKENLDNRICDVEVGATNTQTYREYFREAEEEFDMYPSDLDDMEEIDLVRYLDFLDDLMNK